jgi:tetratricopeptide (TPR) repeat protein
MRSRLGRFEEAVASYDEVVKIKPDDHQAWNNRGNALLIWDGLKKRCILRSSCEIKPDYHSWNNRG